MKLHAPRRPQCPPSGCFATRTWCRMLWEQVSGLTNKLSCDCITCASVLRTCVYVMHTVRRITSNARRFSPVLRPRCTHPRRWALCSVTSAARRDIDTYGCVRMHVQMQKDRTAAGRCHGKNHERLMGWRKGACGRQSQWICGGGRPHVQMPGKAAGCGHGEREG